MITQIVLLATFASVIPVFGYNAQPWDGGSIVTVSTLVSFVKQVDVDIVQKVESGKILLPTAQNIIESEAISDINQAFKVYLQEKLDVSHQEFPEFLTPQDYYFYDAVHDQLHVPVWNDFDYTVGFVFSYLAHDLQILQYETLKEILQKECAKIRAEYDVWTLEKMESQLISWEHHIETLKHEHIFVTTGHEKGLKKFLKLAHVFMFMQMVGSLEHSDIEKDIMDLFENDEEAIVALSSFGIWYLLIMYGQLPF